MHLDAILHVCVYLPTKSFRLLRKLIGLFSAFVDVDLYALADVVDRLTGQHRPRITPPFDNGFKIDKTDLCLLRL
jgi:hypothetical protein